MSRVIVVGAGISGLALAYRLRQACPAHQVLVLERFKRAGGTVWTECSDGFQVEYGPNGFLSNVPATWQLAQELGLAGELIAASDASARKRFLKLRGRLRPLPVSLRSVLTTDLLNWHGKLGLLGEPFRGRSKAPEESLAAFARRRLGPEAGGLIAHALATGIYGGDPNFLSAQAAFPRLAALEGKHGSLVRGLLRVRRLPAQASAPRRAMWSFRHGMRQLVEALCCRLGPSLVPGATAIAIEKLPQHGSSAGWRVHASPERTWDADALVLCCPSYSQAALLEEIDRPLARLAKEIPYNRIAVVALGYRQNDVPGRVEGFGYIMAEAAGHDVLGVQWCSSIFPGRAPEGMNLLRALCGGWRRPEVVGWDDERLVAAVTQEVATTMRILGKPVWSRVIRWDRAIPQYGLGHGRRVAWIEARARRHAGLFLGGNAYHGVALNDCTSQAAVLADQVAAYVGGRSGTAGRE